jgi:hypothetical protein
LVPEGAGRGTTDGAGGEKGARGAILTVLNVHQDRPGIDPMSLRQVSPCAPDCPDALEELRQQARRCLEELFAFCLDEEPRSYLALEKALRDRLFALGLILLRLVLLARHQRLDVTDWLQRGYRLADAAAPRTLKTIFGVLEYARVYLRPPKGRKGEGVHPLDVALGLGRDSHSPLLIGWFCRLATRLSYRLAAQMGGLFVAAAPAPRTIEGWVLGLGRPAYAFLSEGPLPQGDGEVLVIQIDGKAAPTATAEELAKRRRPRAKLTAEEACPDGCGCGCGAKKPGPKRCQRHRGRAKRKCRGKKKKRKAGDKSKNGRSAVLVAMYTLAHGADGRLHGPINKKVYGSFGCRRAALEWARKQATRRGFGPGTAKTIQIVVDGELCLEVGLRELFPDAILTLDIRHAQERLWWAGRALHKPGSEALAAWVEPLEELLYEGQIEELLRRLRQAHAGLSLRAPGTAEKRATLYEVIEYLQKREKMMAYGAWRQQDLEIASGVVEGAARYVVGERLDQSGMRWIEENAECLLLLRCIEVNGDWDAFWDWAQQQRGADLQKGKRVRIRSRTPTQLPRNQAPKKKLREAG